MRLYMHLTSPPFSTVNFHIKSASLGNTLELASNQAGGSETRLERLEILLAWDAGVVVHDVEEWMDLHFREPLVSFQHVSHGSLFLTYRQKILVATHRGSRANKRQTLFLLDGLLGCSALRFHGLALDNGQLV